MHAFRKLSVWRKAHELALRVYQAAPLIGRHYPALAGQMLRAAHGIPANIAEGSGRSTGAQFANFLQIAIGSARELDYYRLLAADLGAIPRSQHATLGARTEEVIMMLVGLKRTVKRSRRPPTPPPA